MNVSSIGWTKEFKIPKELDARPDDLVSYKAQTRDCPSTDLTGAACYSQHMYVLPTTEFWLRPLQKGQKSAMTFDDFVKWVNLCIANGIMLPTAKASHEDGQNLLHLPVSDENRHIVYASLCCYRWSENQPGSPYTVVRAMEEQPDIDFFQAFHYGCIQQVYWPLHSFHPIQVDSSSKSVYRRGSNTNENRYVPYSLALANFFRPKNGKTLAKEMAGRATTSDTVVSSLGVVDAPSSYMLKKTEHLLHPDLTPFYRQEKLDFAGLCDTIKKLNS